MNNLKFKAGDRVIFKREFTEEDWNNCYLELFEHSLILNENYIIEEVAEDYEKYNWIAFPNDEYAYPACCFELYNPDQEKSCDIEALKQILLYSPNYIKVNNQEELRKLYNIYKKIGINKLPINPHLPSYFSRIGASSEVINYDIHIETTCTGLKFYNLSDLLKSFDKYKKHEV